MSCPSDFQKGAQGCTIRCPYDFKFLSASSGIGGRCVHQQFNDQFVTLNVYGTYNTTKPEPPEFNQERQRFNEQINKIRTAVQSLQAEQSRLANTQSENIPFSGQYTSLQAQFAGYNTVKNAANDIKTTVDAMPRKRQPTAPRKDIDEERRRVFAVTQDRVRLLQVALFTVLICTVVYLVLPTSLAHGVAFLVACVGVAVGIFLSST